MNRAALFLLLLLAAACAHGAGLTSTESVYENRQGDRIVITPNTITIGAVVHPLTDCSNADTFCAASEEIGFRVSFPRRCPGFAWVPENGPMQLESIWPHGGGARYVTRGGSPFIYDWQNNYGLVMLVYDPQSDFADRTTRYPRGTSAIYEHRSGPRPFACH